MQKSKCLKSKRQKVNPLPDGGGEGLMQAHEFFWNGRRTAGRIALIFCTAYGVSFAQLLAKELTGSGQVTDL